MKYMNSLFIVVVIYLLVHGIGLWITWTGPGDEKGIKGKIEDGEIPPMIEGGPEDPTASLQIFLYVIVMTGVLLILLKYKFDIVITILISLGLLGGLSITLWGLIGECGLFIALPLFLFWIWKRGNIVLTNLILLLAVPGIGSWLGSSPALGFINSLILLIGLTVYDIVAVFGTKHMVTLAEGAKGKIPMMFTIPVGDRYLGLGTGDLVIPLVFTVSVLSDYSLINAIAASLGGCLGLIILFLYILNKEDVTLPALPPIALGLILGFAVGLILYP